MKKREEKISGQAPNDNVSGSEFPMNAEGKYNRYTDEELLEFKEIVLSKLNEAQADYELLNGTLLRQQENAGEDQSATIKFTEDAGDIFSKEEIVQLTLRQQKYIENLQNALGRIDNKTFGICRISGRLIAKERLKNAPHTTMCLDAKLEMSRLN